MNGCIYLGACNLVVPMQKKQYKVQFNYNSLRIQQYNCKTSLIHHVYVHTYEDHLIKFSIHTYIQTNSN